MDGNVEAGRTYDLLVVGGGINGAGIARDAAGRGLSVLLVEQDDLASHTSSASTKLIHGGLRYLEYYEFRLVREALMERERLLASAPHIIWPLRFLLPHASDLRPAWMIRLGLFLYDHLGGRKRLPGSTGVDLAVDPMGRPLKPEFRKGFAYSDCWVEDSRLVVLNAMDAAERGAQIRTRTRCVQARRENLAGRALWRAEIEDRRSGRRETVMAHALVNATGPWVKSFFEGALALPARHNLRLVKGSHIVLPRLYEGEHAYILQNRDRRIVFAIPYEHRFTLVGTTDIAYEGDPSRVAISAEEARYLCDVISRHFRRPVAPQDAVWSYAGVRPLYEDDAAASASAVTRDYVLDLDGTDGQAPLLSIFGGKITTFRRLAEQALAKLAPFFPDMSGPWTADTYLPGGDMPDVDFDRFLAKLERERPWLGSALARRLARAYGTRAGRLLADCRSPGDLGPMIGGSLSERELAYLADAEWAETAEDVLWRRSKLGLHLPADAAAAIDRWFAGRNRLSAAAAS